MQTDFPPEPLDAGVPWCSVLGVGGALFTTFALGFTEGCLERATPIPLRFALRFAAANVLPSVVFRSVPARHVAAASGVPLSALISDTDVASSRSAAVGKRLVLVKSVRALRLAAGSYGLAWNLWRWHESDTASSNNNGNKEGVKYGESVVRLAPVNSPLSRASRRKHRDHIMTVPLNTESSKKPGEQRLGHCKLGETWNYARDLAVDEKKEASALKILLGVATGLLYRHGITSSVLTTRDKKIVDENAEREGGAGHSIDSNLKTKEQNATEQQETAEVDEATYLSVTDVTDQTLQGIRNLVRQGNKPDAIQAAVYRAFGTQRVVAPTRLDQSSDMHI
ncbi:hypothetical protein GQ600_7324 [Phytophthora cactorum]|nr:hypothetical protein GQ600_7324 [Phytophthora cactorum]